MLRAVLAFLGLAVAVLVGGQLALPRIAERRITSDLSHSGQVRQVSVEATPAIKLLFGRADLVTLGPLRLHGARLTKDHDQLEGQATVSEAELAAALPPQLSVRPVSD